MLLKDMHSWEDTRFARQHRGLSSLQALLLLLPGVTPLFCMDPSHGAQGEGSRWPGETFTRKVQTEAGPSHSKKKLRLVLGLVPGP